MNRVNKMIVSLLLFLVSANGIYYTALADHEEKRRYQKREREHSGKNDKRNLKTVDNNAYKENCSACHFSYQPELLPAGSWQKIIAGLDDHFGETITIDTEAKKIISEYLSSNATEFSSTELAGKIMRSLVDQKPLRITEIPYIQREHRQIKKEVFKRESIGSLSNCLACHKTAVSGIYDDDVVIIPR